MAYEDLDLPEEEIKALNETLKKNKENPNINVTEKILSPIENSRYRRVIIITAIILIPLLAVMLKKAGMLN